MCCLLLELHVKLIWKDFCFTGRDKNVTLKTRLGPQVTAVWSSLASKGHHSATWVLFFNDSLSV